MINIVYRDLFFNGRVSVLAYFSQCLAPECKINLMSEISGYDPDFKYIIGHYILKSLNDLLVSFEFRNLFRGTQREYSSTPLKHSIVKHILVFKR